MEKKAALKTHQQRKKFRRKKTNKQKTTAQTLSFEKLAWPVSKQQDNRKQEAEDREKGRQARKRPSTTFYFCSRLIAPQAAGCWRCLSGPSPTWGYLVEVVRALRAGRWPPLSGRCWRTPAIAAGSPRGWMLCRPWPNRCWAERRGKEKKKKRHTVC